MRSSRSRTRGNSTIQKAEEQHETPTQIDDITERSMIMTTAETTCKRPFECLFEKMHMDISDCSDDGSSDCPLCVPGATCHMTLDDVLETQCSSGEWYELRHKVTPYWEEKWFKEELDKLRSKQ